MKAHENHEVEYTIRPLYLSAERGFIRMEDLKEPAQVSRLSRRTVITLFRRKSRGSGRRRCRASRLWANRLFRSYNDTSFFRGKTAIFFITQRIRLPIFTFTIHDQVGRTSFLNWAIVVY